MNPNLIYSPLTKAGRRANGYERDGGQIVHAVALNHHKALCGAAPGRRSDWSSWPSPAVTCPKCLKKMGES